MYVYIYIYERTAQNSIQDSQNNSSWGLKKKKHKSWRDFVIFQSHGHDISGPRS